MCFPAIIRFEILTEYRRPCGCGVRLGEHVVALVPAVLALGGHVGHLVEVEVSISLWLHGLDVGKCTADGPQEVVADPLTLRIRVEPLAVLPEVREPSSDGRIGNVTGREDHWTSSIFRSGLPQLPS